MPCGASRNDRLFHPAKDCCNETGDKKELWLLRHRPPVFCKFYHKIHQTGDSMSASRSPSAYRVEYQRAVASLLVKTCIHSRHTKTNCDMFCTLIFGRLIAIRICTSYTQLAEGQKYKLQLPEAHDPLGKGRPCARMPNGHHRSTLFLRQEKAIQRRSEGYALDLPDSL
jgi:hypothetical protein